jgi:hypothetical protein
VLSSRVFEPKSNEILYHYCDAQAFHAISTAYVACYTAVVTSVYIETMFISYLTAKPAEI